MNQYKKINNYKIIYFKIKTYQIIIIMFKNKIKEFKFFY